MKNSELLPLYAGMDYLSKVENLPVKTSFKVAKVHSSLRTALEPFDSVRNGIVVKYINPATNQPKDPTANSMLSKELSDLLTQEVSGITTPARTMKANADIVPPYLLWSELVQAKRLQPSKLELLVREGFIEQLELIKENFPSYKTITADVSRMEAIARALNELGSQDLPVDGLLFAWVINCMVVVMAAGDKLVEENTKNPNGKAEISLPTLGIQFFEILPTIKPEVLSTLADFITES